jgi:hypothetical protein
MQSVFEFETFARFVARAEELRALADQISNGERRTALLRAAEAFDERASSKPPKCRTRLPADL